ncbi:hypothetical protein MBM_00004 [Drepanopeziza brunnea f. sp. 'multigermtubi' MB_m1]|uniref:Uncharacterized protein n=1 Tax=Marssonina brunnea f. sp. multigermtubi (strain MB_m1) TaxID=1072389 RepID=K1X727_MARBU|nr:uncharacterized protein MBM_00004 [Drepanopeziza brunnea f. sp. 'multigermtubi' MB_m1]EKD20891.1 hypothetical protein MBM_00004 [Drepanopeziza brunnea f. sp. 'multigermtubi' MB_m1]
MRYVWQLYLRIAALRKLRVAALRTLRIAATSSAPLAGYNFSLELSVFSPAILGLDEAFLNIFSVATVNIIRTAAKGGIMAYGTRAAVLLLPSQENATIIPTTPQHHTKPYHTIPYHRTPYHTTPYHTTPHRTTPYHNTTPSYTTPSHTTRYHTTGHHTTRHHTTRHYTIIPHQATLYQAIPHDTILQDTTLHDTAPHYTAQHRTLSQNSIQRYTAQPVQSGQHSTALSETIDRHYALASGERDLRLRYHNERVYRPSSQDPSGTTTSQRAGDRVEGSQEAKERFTRRVGPLLVDSSNRGAFQYALIVYPTYIGEV